MIHGCVSERGLLWYSFYQFAIEAEKIKLLLDLQEYSEWKKDAPDISLPGVSIGLMDRLNAFSRVIKSSTEELCDKLLSSYLDTLKETCKNGTSQIPHTSCLPVF